MELMARTRKIRNVPKPADGLFYEDAAELINVKPATFRRMCGDGRYAPGSRAKPPEPDGHEITRGSARPWWHRKTIEQWADNRPGRGVGGGRRAGQSAGH
jgi:hypothetical protein